MIRRSPNATSALLQKVSSQLKGERIKKDDEEEDLNAYLKSLTQKTAQQRKSVNFEDVGDISISSEMDTSSSQLKKRNVPTAGNKFLKKKPMGETKASKFLKKPEISSASPVPTVSSQGRPDNVRSQSVGQASRTSRPDMAKSQSLGQGGRTSALNKAAALSNKFAQRSAEMRNVFTLETDTSESLSTPRPQTPLGRPKSADSDSFKLGKDGNKFLKKKPEARESSPVKPRSPVSRSPKSTSPVPDRRNDKQKISKQKHKPETRESDKKVSPYTLRSSLKYSTDVVLSSGEESLAEFISGLDKKGLKNKEKKGQQQRHEIGGKRRSPSPSTLQRSPSPDTKPPTVRRTPSPSTPRRSQSPIFRRRSPSPQYRRSRSRSSGDSDFGDSLQSEVIQEIREEDSVSSEDAFGVKLMDVDSLEPVLIASPSKSSVSKEKKKGKEKQKKTGISFKKEEKVLEKKKKKDLKRRKSDNDDIFSSFGIQTVDDLLGGISGLDEKVEIASLASEASEIKTQSESEEIHTEKPSVLGQKFKSHSVVESEIRTQGSRSSSRKNSYSEDFEDSISERIGMTSTRASRLKSLSEIQTRYSGDDTVVEDYTEEFGSDTESIATISKNSQTSEKTITDSYRTESETETYTQSDKSPRTDSRIIRSKKTRTAEVQTSEPGLHYTWDSRYSGYAVPGPGPAFTDPTPIATHVVSADALEAMTAYSPSMLALQDLLRQQLQLTREFLHTQRYLYKSLADNIDTSYKYTTLEETKQYIKKNRKKKLTFKEALRMVDRECG